MDQHCNYNWLLFSSSCIPTTANNIPSPHTPRQRPSPRGPNTTPTISITPNTAIMSPLATTPLAQTAGCSPTFFPCSAAATCALLFRSTRSDAPAATTAETCPWLTENTSGKGKKMLWSVSEICVGMAFCAMEVCFFATDVALDPGAENDVEYRAGLHCPRSRPRRRGYFLYIQSSLEPFGLEDLGPNPQPVPQLPLRPHRIAPPSFLIAVRHHPCHHPRSRLHSTLVIIAHAGLPQGTYRPLRRLIQIPHARSLRQQRIKGCS
ncbi:hypothetical protein FIBSPDRAFT_857117 [Athelia psychrophila]|uniref:Uncharacterized protein n=1 Tax=Athelia psychrophila TaxID=1759441 RepID=A0A166MXY3_9AGAM|nr:hypothetical protein FIBSPDRAFT_857117 [Fibularhizoctonia sp. CBS 109695]